MMELFKIKNISWLKFVPQLQPKEFTTIPDRSIKSPRKYAKNPGWPAATDPPNPGIPHPAPWRTLPPQPATIGQWSKWAGSITKAPSLNAAKAGRPLVRSRSSIVENGPRRSRRRCRNSPSPPTNHHHPGAYEGWNTIIERRTMVYYGVLWCAMVCYGVLWCTMVYYGVLWCTMVCYGVLGCTMVYYDVLWCGVVWCAISARGQGIGINVNHPTTCCIGEIDGQSRLWVWSCLRYFAWREMGAGVYGRRWWFNEAKRCSRLFSGAGRMWLSCGTEMKFWRLEPTFVWAVLCKQVKFYVQVKVVWFWWLSFDGARMDCAAKRCGK